MARVLLMFVLPLLLAVVALISCLSAEEGDIRGLPRIVWVLIILLFPFVGAIAWFLAGRTPRTAATGGGRFSPPAVRGPRPRPRPVAPDDDPEFLRSLDSAQDKELLSKWEADLRRREEEMRRRREQGPEPTPEA